MNSGLTSSIFKKLGNGAFSYPPWWIPESTMKQETSEMVV